MTEQQSEAVHPAADDFDALKRLVDCLRPLDPESRVRLLKSAITFLRLDGEFKKQTNLGPEPEEVELFPGGPPSFSSRVEMTPKQFVLEKRPHNDIERVACLGYYLTHYRDMPEFKTLDISKLNTEAAQPKFSNASVPVENATRRGFLVPSAGGNKQLGAIGEQFVQALPDRDAAKDLLDRVRIRKPRRKRDEKGNGNGSQGDD